jgi:DNA-binding helix-hairpin-helix protein with protein kinase domain
VTSNKGRKDERQAVAAPAQQSVKAEIWKLVARSRKTYRVASASTASEVTAVATTLAVAPVTKANTRAKRMKILRMIVVALVAGSPARLLVG